jgi:hypothetical protein
VPASIAMGKRPSVAVMGKGGSALGMDRVIVANARRGAGPCAV